MSAGVTARPNSILGARAAARTESSAAELIVDLVSAGLASVMESDDGDISYALTPQGRHRGRQMTMSRQARALMLGGALTSADEISD